MTEPYPSAGDDHEPEGYEIRLKGHLDQRWAGSFEGLSVIHEADGTTILAGAVSDQAMLYGLLRKARDLGLPLLAVNQIDPQRVSGPDGTATADQAHSSQETLP